MIRVLKDCFDKFGNRYKVIAFNSGLYQCQSYATGKCSYFPVNEISASPPTLRTNDKVVFTDIIKETPKEKEIVEPDVAVMLEPSYESKEEDEIVEPDYGDAAFEKGFSSQDNIKETADDFYADF